MGWFDSSFLVWVGSVLLYILVTEKLMRSGRLTYL